MKMIQRRINRAFPFLLLFALLPSCSFLKEMTALQKCEFRMTTLENPELAGIDVSEVRSFTDIGILEMGIISSSIMKGQLPLDFILNIEARNPNPVNAALNRIAYIAYIDKVEVASGEMAERVEIPGNGGISTIPLALHTDLIEILNKDSRQALVNFGLNLADAGNRPTRVSLKLKPTILVGGLEINYPGYFTVRYEFSSGD